MERRKHRRFAATAFLNRPVTLTPVAPFFGKAIKGKLIDLSAGGLSMLIQQIIPQGTRLHLTITFPDHSHMESDIEVVRTMPRDRNYVIGLEFLNLDLSWVERIETMSAQYIECEQRIQATELTPCIGKACTLFDMCNKSERTNLLINVDEELLLNMAVLAPLK